jgi:hypothetical protein
VGSRRLVEGLRPVVEGARDGGLLDAFSAILPDREYSRKDHTRFLFLRRPSGPFAAYEKQDFLVPNDELVAAVGALLEGAGGLARFERYRQETGRVRDLLVCTHGSRDICCGKFGYPVYDLLRRRHAARGELRVWRTSHIGGHRFAPTMIDYPEGRYWGHLEPWAAEKVAARSGPVSDLGPFYRGWGGLRSPSEQVAEREIFALEGWAWTGYLKEGHVLASGDDRAEVRIVYRSPGRRRLGRLRGNRGGHRHRHDAGELGQHGVDRGRPVPRRPFGEVAGRRLGKGGPVPILPVFSRARGPDRSARVGLSGAAAAGVVVLLVLAPAVELAAVHRAAARVGGRVDDEVLVVGVLARDLLQVLPYGAQGFHRPLF